MTITSFWQGQLVSAGLTIAATAYTAGDQLGTLLTVPCPASPHMRVVDISVLDEASVMGTGGVEVWLFNGTVTPATDNAAAAFSDADARKLVGIAFATTVTSLGANNKQLTTGTTPLNIHCTTGALFANLVTRNANTFFTAVTDLRVNLTIELTRS